LRSDSSRPWLLVLCLLAGAAASAHVGPHGNVNARPTPGATAAVMPGQRWHFTLATLDGERFVQSSRLPGPVLVNFWGRDCAPCINELPRLAAFALANPQWTVLLVSTDATQAASEFLTQRGITLTALRSGANVTGLMRAAGNRSGGLPYSVALRDGIVCNAQLGELTDTTLQAWAASSC